LSRMMPVTGNTETTQPENRAFYPALDGLRAIAFMMVFMEHYYYFPWGFTGVNVFFVLSGFLITGILFDTRDDPHRARTFYIRRTLRIFPLYYAIFLILLLLHPFLHWEWSLAWIAWPLYLGNFLRYLSPASAVPGSRLQLAADAQLYSARSQTQLLYMGHFWSLCVEEQFYLVWPWIVFWVRNRRALIWICSAVVIAVPLARVFAQHGAPAWMLQQELLYRATPFQLDSLLLGGLVGLLWRGANRDLLLKIARVVAGIAVVAATVYCFRTFHIHEPNWRRNYPYPLWRLTWGLFFVNIFSASLILSLLRPAGILFRAFCWKPLRWVGRISYGAYVLHDIFHSFFYTYFGVWFLDWIASHTGSHFGVLEKHRNEIFPVFALGATFFLAWLSFRFLETPFLRLKNRLAAPGS